MDADQAVSSDLEEAIAAGYRRRDRTNMAPTIEYFCDLLCENPGNAAVLLEVAGAYDTAGQESQAESFYVKALDAGLSGDRLRRAKLQYGSTLRNLGRFDESLKILNDALTDFPDSASLRVFRALTLHAAGKPSAALADILLMVTDKVEDAEIERYSPAIRGNAQYLASLDR